MNILSNILAVMGMALNGFFICYVIWDIFKSIRSRIMGLCPLTGTKAKSESMYPLAGTELVNEASTVNKTQPVNVTQALTKQTSTKREGGK